MARRALIVVHDPGETAGMVGRRLEARGFELDELSVTLDLDDPRSDVEFPAIGEHDIIVPMGAVYSVYDTATIGTWIERELELLRAADRAGVPVFGICFGGQALAAALGGRVVAADEAQVGWYEIPSETPELGTGPWMQWHYDRFEAPPDAEVLSVDRFGTQAFRLRRNLGLQFHPEVDVAHLRRWLDMGGADLLPAHGLTADGLIAATVVNAENSRPQTDRLVDWFLDHIAVVPVG
ncbi:MAG: gamma-glutamyl-gamma-aminobutyrate hydrolase family protein [Actinomycetota bacterium]